MQKQTSIFAEIMVRHEEAFGDGSKRVKMWGDALREAAYLSGWHLGHGIHDNGMADFDSDMLLEEYSVFKTFSKEELVRATNDFCDKIGVAIAGSVYRGMPDDGREAAI
ncbi:hypothetical protein NL676_023656 [Syzygium grande]|nr:hypothetical protein NL676_023656 [Syzygium grande]